MAPAPHSANTKQVNEEQHAEETGVQSHSCTDCRLFPVSPLNDEINTTPTTDDDGDSYGGDRGGDDVSIIIIINNRGVK